MIPLKLIKDIQTVNMTIKQYIVMINLQIQHRYIEAKRLCTNSWKKCWRRSNNMKDYEKGIQQTIKNDERGRREISKR